MIIMIKCILDVESCGKVLFVSGKYYAACILVDAITAKDEEKDEWRVLDGAGARASWFFTHFEFVVPTRKGR
jgi:hypothetical protein